MRPVFLTDSKDESEALHLIDTYIEEKELFYCIIPFLLLHQFALITLNINHYIKNANINMINRIKLKYSYLQQEKSSMDGCGTVMLKVDGLKDWITGCFFNAAYHRNQASLL